MAYGAEDSELIGEVLISNLGQDIGNHKIFVIFLSCSRKMRGWYLKLRQDHLSDNHLISCTHPKIDREVQNMIENHKKYTEMDRNININT
jgi:hypothetical protein